MKHRNWYVHLPVLVILLTLCGGFADAGAATRVRYIVRKGDVMSRLFGADYRKVAAANNIKDPNRIKVGQSLAIPDGVRLRTVAVASGKQGFAVKTINGDLQWRSGRDKLYAYPSKGPSAIRLLMPEVSYAEAKALWDQLCAVPVNGRFEKAGNGVLSAVLDDSTRTRLDLSNGMMIGGRKAIRYTGSLKLAKGDALKADHLSALHVGDRWLIRPKVCGNLLLGRGGERPPDVEPPSEVPAPPVTPPSISVIPSKEGCNAEYELIVGAGVWENEAAHGNFQWGEGLISCELGDGYSAGIGFYGYGGSGESGTGYSWDEGGFGPQVGFKRNFLASHHDEFGQEVLYPAGWQVKLRCLPNDYVEGESDSYHVKQWGRKYGFYGEYWQRTSESALYGVSAEAWWYDATRFSSSWSGDSPQDRGSQAMSLFAQYRLNDDWQIRPIGKIFHQNWDDVIFAQVIPEFRYKEHVMVSPWASFPIINGKGAGPTRGLTLRYELYGKLREKYERDGIESVEALGTMAEVAAPDSTSGAPGAELSDGQPTVERQEVPQVTVSESTQTDSSVAASWTEVPDEPGTEISIFSGQ